MCGRDKHRTGKYQHGDEAFRMFDVIARYTVDVADETINAKRIARQYVFIPERGTEAELAINRLQMMMRD